MMKGCGKDAFGFCLFFYEHSAVLTSLFEMAFLRLSLQ